MPHRVLVVGELAGGVPTPTTLELLSGASALADGGEVGVTLLGSGAGAAMPLALGAQRAYVSEDPAYDSFIGDQWLPAIEAAVDQANADLVLIAQSTAGREIGPRLAHRRGTAVAMDCVSLVDEGGAIRATRPCYGGAAMATYSFATSPAIATVRAKSFEVTAGAPPADRVDLPAPGATRVTIASREQAQSEGLQLQDAPIVVSGGRGLGAPEGFQMLEELAQTIGQNRAAVGSSRAAVDMGWYPPSQQIGLTGKVVTPDVYIAVAISGASQHMAGCSGSKVIVAINRDRDANIFNFARYGIVGDYKEVVPELIKAIKSTARD